MKLSYLVAVGWALTCGSEFLSKTTTCSAQEARREAPSAWKAGVSTTKITPDQRLAMAGYASRKEPAEGTEQELFAKALALEDAGGQRVVFITLDLIGVQERLRTSIAKRLADEYRLPSECLVMNASHTHCGPDYQKPEAAEYYARLEKSIGDAACQAVAALQPATLSWGMARCGFAMNRRTPSSEGYRNHPNPEGPVDHSVPVLRIGVADGKLRAVLFGYACHNTTMGFRKWLGDYAGYAQEYLEQDHPGVVAMFLMGCGGDQNPYPRSQLKYAQQHGRSLATAVEAALEVGQTAPRHQHPVRGPLRCALQTVELEFTVADRAPFAYPVQAVRFGDDLLIVTLGSEVVIDYVLRLKKELGGPGQPAVWVAGYSNVYAGYIPSRRVLEEGGYEAQSRPWNPNLEERIIRQVHQVAGQVARPSGG